MRQLSPCLSWRGPWHPISPALRYSLAAGNGVQIAILLPPAHAWPEVRAAAGAISLAINEANAMLGGVELGEAQVRRKLQPLVRVPTPDDGCLQFALPSEWAHSYIMRGVPSR